MLMGPALAGPLIGYDAVIGASLISSWNIISLIFEICIMHRLYHETPSLRQSSTTRSEAKKSSSVIAWFKSWSKWSRSKIFIPGLALAILFANVFQLSYIAQAYIATHCISDNLMGIVWMIAGIFGLLGIGFILISNLKEQQLFNFLLVLKVTAKVLLLTKTR